MLNSLMFFFTNPPSETIHWGILDPGAYSPRLLRYVHKESLVKKNFMCLQVPISSDNITSSWDYMPLFPLHCNVTWLSYLGKNLLRVKNREQLSLYLLCKSNVVNIVCVVESRIINNISNFLLFRSFVRCLSVFVTIITARPPSEPLQK